MGVNETFMITDWLMVVITLIYVITTIKISKANVDSAKATREQVEDSRVQFEKNQRLQVMPSMQIDILDELYNEEIVAEIPYSLYSDEHLDSCRSYTFFLALENAGMGTAKDITFRWFNTEGNPVEEKLPKHILYQQDKMVYLISVGITEKNATIGEKHEPKLVISFKDLLDNEYSQTIQLTYVIGSNKYPMLERTHINKIKSI